MKNIYLLKRKLFERINRMTSEELYEYILQPKPVITSLCKYCEQQEWEDECLETMADDSLCLSRFKLWCEMENTVLLKQEELER